MNQTTVERIVDKEKHGVERTGNFVERASIKEYPRECA